MPPQIYQVLFVCAGEPTRGVVAHALMDRWGGDRFRASSASLGAAAEVDPLTIELLKARRLWRDQSCAKCDELIGDSGPAFDFVISVGERIPDSIWNRFPHHPVKAHWRITDPIAAKVGDLRLRKTGIARTFTELENRIRLFILAQRKPRRLAA